MTWLVSGSDAILEIRLVLICIWKVTRNSLRIARTPDIVIAEALPKLTCRRLELSFFPVIGSKGTWFEES